jgi:sec-independent protein translocase protein TatA
MLGDLFDSPWKILIIAAVVLILFGSKKMPDAARSLGRSMRILKTEIKDMHEDDSTGGAQAGQPQPVPPQQLAATTGTPVTGVPVTGAEGVPVAPPASVPVPPAAVPVPEPQQDTRPA